jgi:hypothetical protein
MPPIEEALSDFSKNPAEAEDGTHLALAKIVEHSAGYASMPRSSVKTALKSRTIQN